MNIAHFETLPKVIARAEPEAIQQKITYNGLPRHPPFGGCLAMTEAGWGTTFISGGTMSAEEKLAAIRDYVLRERIRRGIIPSQQEPGIKLSCFEVGEYFNLVERQLLVTEEGFGAWLELAHPPVLDGAYRYVIYFVKR